MSAFCFEHGITHLFMAPYTSAHNRCAECLHCTLLEKAHMMRIACEAPPSMWDEFCATAAFLTNLSASTSLNGRTPYEHWFNCLLSLTHSGDWLSSLCPCPFPQPQTPSSVCPLHNDWLRLGHQSLPLMGPLHQPYLQFLSCHFHRTS